MLEEDVIDGVGDVPVWEVIAEVVAPVGAVARADGEHAGDEMAEAMEEEPLEEEFCGAARAVAEPGLGAEEHGNAEGFGRQQGLERGWAGVAVQPESVEGRCVAAASETTEEAVVPGVWGGRCGERGGWGGIRGGSPGVRGMSQWTPTPKPLSG